MTGAGAPPAALVHRLAGEQAIARGHRMLDPVALEAVAVAEGLDHETFLAALLALAGERVVDVHTFGGSLVTLLRLTENGFLAHLTVTRGDLDEVRHRVADAVRAHALAGMLDEAVDLAGDLGEPRLVVEVLLDELRTQGRLVFTNLQVGLFRIHRVG